MLILLINYRETITNTNECMSIGSGGPCYFGDGTLFVKVQISYKTYMEMKCMTATFYY